MSISEEISYPAGGGSLPAFLVRPDSGDSPRPAVVLVHEILGLTDHIRGVAQRLAEEGGYAVLVPDLFSRYPEFVTLTEGDLLEAIYTMFYVEDSDAALAALSPERRKVIEQGMSFIDRLREFAEDIAGRTQMLPDLVAGVDFLKAQPYVVPGQVAALGFCYGGQLVNLLAAGGCDLAAGISYYGENPPLAEVSAIRCAMLAHYAGLDPDVETAEADYQAAMAAAGKHLESHIYAGAAHAFNNDTLGPSYSKDASDLAWARSVAFLAEQLSSTND
jgi:carboxymethylenebutenolidase